MLEWWGYLHTNGSLQVKRYFGPEDIAEARESPFVNTVYGPWECSGREEALELLKKNIMDPILSRTWEDKNRWLT